MKLEPLVTSGGYSLDLEWRVRELELVKSARAHADSAFDAHNFHSAGRDHWLDVLSKSPVGESLLIDSADPQLEMMASTHSRANAAVDFVLATEREPLVLSGAVARIAETSIHTFTAPSARKHNRNLSAAKRHGTFFTPQDVALTIARKALEGKDDVGLVLEPASGTGMLTTALLVEAAFRGIRVSTVEVWELNHWLAAIADRTVRQVVRLLNTDTVVLSRQTDALDRLNASSQAPEIVVLNPPYGRIKFLKNSLSNAETQIDGDHDSFGADERDRLTSLRLRLRDLSKKWRLDRPSQDLQTLFIAGAVHAVAGDGRVVVISPSSWTTGRESLSLRKLIIGRRMLVSLTMFPESAMLFQTVNQPTSIAVLEPDNSEFEFEVSVMKTSEVEASSSVVKYGQISDRDGYRIPIVESEMMGIYGFLSQTAKLGELEHVTNARGELDLTLDANLITASPTSHRLIRGDHVERYLLGAAHSSQRASYVTDDGYATIGQRPKGKWLGHERVVGRQVAYMGKHRRMTYVVVPPDSIVANSCNFLVGATSNETYAIAALLNSLVSEWWFAAHSSNNHVSNYELSDVPWAITSAEIVDALSTISRTLHDATSETQRRFAEDTCEAVVIYGLQMPYTLAAKFLEEVAPQRAANILAKLRWIQSNGTADMQTSSTSKLQHYLPTLSALDYEMLGHVPQGGNWQHIPVSVPSARLAQIRAMTEERGVVRTTYYGRLKPDQPSYTVATYYNRPGNGTNIHPNEDRTLTHREAARLQSFPDSYQFIGPEGAIRKQIGNAVPPLLGYAVARQIASYVGGDPVVDMFAGAGGLSAGIELQGAEVAVAVDHDKYCQSTYTFNRPSELIADPTSDRTLFVKADLSDPVEREMTLMAIKQKLGSRQIGALVGGPPCQGFSHAGFRDETDSRNDLATAFLDFARVLKPNVVVLENVEGLLSYRKGQTIRDLQTTLRELGYQVGQPWVLAAEQYGVPQMRRRVFLVATRNDLVPPPVPVAQRCLGRRETTAAMTSALPYPYTVAEAFSGLPALGEFTHPNRGSREVRNAFARWADGQIGVEDVLGGLAEPT